MFLAGIIISQSNVSPYRAYFFVLSYLSQIQGLLGIINIGKNTEIKYGMKLDLVNRIKFLSIPE